MSDNVSVTPGAGAVFATDEIGGVHWQRVKLTYGADGSATDVSATPGSWLPVAVLNSDTPGALLDASAVHTVSGVGWDWRSLAKGGTFLIDVTAASGTGQSLVVKVQQSLDGATWYDLDPTNAATGAISTPGQRVLRIYPGLPNAANATCNNLLTYHTRLAWTITGTSPSFTFSTVCVPAYT